MGFLSKIDAVNIVTDEKPDAVKKTLESASEDVSSFIHSISPSAKSSVACE